MSAYQEQHPDNQDFWAKRKVVCSRRVYSAAPSNAIIIISRAIYQMSVDFLCSVIRRQLIELNAKQAEEFNITSRYSVCMFALWLTYTPVERHRLRVGVSRQYDIFGVLIRKRGADAIWWEKRVHKWAKEKLLEYKWNIVICNSSNVRNFIVAARCVTPYA